MKVVKNAESRWDVLNAANEVVFNAETRVKANEWKKANEGNETPVSAPTAAKPAAKATTRTVADAPAASKVKSDPKPVKVAEDVPTPEPVAEPAPTPEPTPAVEAPVVTPIERVLTGDVDREGLFDLLKQVSNRVTALGSPEGITSAQADALELLNKQGATSQNVIARGIGCTGGNVTMIIDNLAKKGLVERNRSAEDRRVVHVSLTNAGLQVAAEVKTTRQDAMNVLFRVAESEFGQKEVNQVAKFLDALLRG